MITLDGAPSSLLTPDAFIRALGPSVLIGLFTILFAECGLFVGSFLPGDSPHAVGLLVATRMIDTPLWLIWLLLVVAALAETSAATGVDAQQGPRCSLRGFAAVEKTLC